MSLFCYNSCFTGFFCECVFACVCVCAHHCACAGVSVCSFSSFFVYFLGNFIFQLIFFFRVWLRLTPVSSCVSCVGLLVQDLTDTILSSYAYKSHYLLTESNRAELKLPMIPSPSSATKKNVGKGNCTVFLFTPLSLCCVSVMCLLLPLSFTFPCRTHLSFRGLGMPN